MSRHGDQPISLVHNLHFSFPIMEANLGLSSLWSLLSLCFEALKIYFPLIAYFKVSFRTPFAPTRVTNVSQYLTIALNKWTNEPPQSIKDRCQLRIIFHVLLEPSKCFFLHVIICVMWYSKSTSFYSQNWSFIFLNLRFLFLYLTLKAGHFP